MLWVTRHEPHVDRCASAWLIKNFIDREALFEFVSKDSPIPEGATAFTLPGAEIRPIEGKSTTFDVLVEKFKVNDPFVRKIQELLHDFEISSGEDVTRVRHMETTGVCLILRGLARTSRTDHETITKAMIVMDSLYAELKAKGNLESVACGFTGLSARPSPGQGRSTLPDSSLWHLRDALHIRI